MTGEDAMDGWTASEANQLRELLDLKLQAFARRLKIHQRTVIRWRDGATDPAAALWEDLDNLLIEAVRKLAPWLNLNQLSKMNRRDILKLLAASTNIPLAGVDVLWNGSLSEVSNTSLSSLEDISTVLASKYNTSPSHMLLGSVGGHLEKAAGLLRTAAMQPSQRQRLESIVADAAIFMGGLSMQTGRLAQADAHLGLAKKMALQASNMALLSQVLAEQALLDYYEQSPEKANDDPRPRVDRLEEAQGLANRHAAPIVQMAISGWLAEDKATAKDSYGADQALEYSQVALEKARLEGSSGTGFCSSRGLYSGWGEGKLEGFRGAVELTLKRPSAASTFETSMQLTQSMRGRALRLTGLAKALIACKQPQEACDSLAKAHTIGLIHGSAIILHHVFSARVLMPTEWNGLQYVRELDERLGWGT
jgi:tetratricopeptide (TPR) repeat protein